VTFHVEVTVLAKVIVLKPQSLAQKTVREGVTMRTTPWPNSSMATKEPRSVDSWISNLGEVLKNRSRRQFVARKVAFLSTHKGRKDHTRARGATAIQARSL
jgi:hypothetical protein